MTDINNIPEATTNLSADTDGDGVVEIHEGEKKDIEKFKKIKVESLSGKEKVEIAVPKDSFLERSFRFAVTTIAGENGIGRAGAVVKDALSQLGLLPPVLNKGSDLIGNALKRKQTNKPMLSKILSIKNFINLEDENGNFSLKELGYSLLQIVLAGAVVYGAQYLGIWEGLMRLLNQG